jgi:hypothetical protein
MDMSIIAAFDKSRAALLTAFGSEEFRPSYGKLLQMALQEMVPHYEEPYGKPDPERITRINHGDHQGTLVFVVGPEGYQPSTVWLTKVYYGSCSYCDTLQRIEDDVEPADRPAQYLTLVLHMIQRMQEF